MPERPDPYKILQVDPEADPEVIQAAYRRLAQKYHPDVASDPATNARMAAINEAWQLLRDPATRARHDLERQGGVGGGGGSAAGGAGAASAGDTSAGAAAARESARPANRPPDVVSSDWTTGRSTSGGGYDPSTMSAPEGLGAAGPPPGHPSGSVMNFGRYAGWSLGEIARRDLDYVEWLDRMPIGRPYRDEIDTILRRAGRRQSAEAESTRRHGLFRRR